MSGQTGVDAGEGDPMLHIELSKKLVPWLAAALVVTGVAAYAVIPDGAGVIHACYQKITGNLRVADGACHPDEFAIAWNQAGVAGEPGPAGPPGPPGPAGSGGGADVFYTENRAPQEIPTSFIPILSINLPAGKYHLTATGLFNNLGATDRVPINCMLVSNFGFSSTIAAVQLEPNGGASGATLPVELATELFSDGSVDLLCVSNTGPGGAIAQVDQCEITATRVGSITVQ